MRERFKLRGRLLILLVIILVGTLYGIDIMQNHDAKAAMTATDFPNVRFDTLFNTSDYQADDIAYSGGYIYTVDYGYGITERIRKYDLNGVKQWGTTDLDTEIPKGICVDSNSVYISVNNTSEVYKYGMDGSYISHVATAGSPYDLVEKDGYLYVVCMGTTQIQKIATSDMSIAATYSISAHSASPKSIATDGVNFYVGDFYDSKVVKYDSNFIYIGEYSDTGLYSQAQDLFCYNGYVNVATGNYIVSISTADMSYAYKWQVNSVTSVCVNDAGNFLAGSISDIKVSRLASSNSSLSSLNVGGSYTLSPAFDSAVTNYTISLPSTATSIVLTPTLADSTASGKINNNLIVSGDAVTYNLGVGDNPIEIVVTAEDGTTKTTYNIIVKVISAPDSYYTRYINGGCQYLSGGITYYDADLYVGQDGQCAFQFNLSDVKGTIVEASLNVKTSWLSFSDGVEFVYDLYSSEDDWVGDTSFPASVNYTPVLMDNSDNRFTEYSKSFDIKDFVNATLQTSDKISTLVLDSQNDECIQLYDNTAVAVMDRPYIYIRVQAIDKITDSYDDTAPEDRSFKITVEDTLSSITNGGYTLIKDTDYTVSNYTVSGDPYSYSEVTIKKEYLTKLATGSYDFTVNLAESTAQTLTVDVTRDTYTIDAISDVTLSEVNKGYAAGTQQTKSITISKTGTMDLTNLQASISGGASSKFTITQPVDKTLNGTTTSTTFTVKANDGLAPGMYKETITISADNMTDVTFYVTQVVNAPPEAKSVNISGTLQLGEILDAYYTFYDAEGNSEGTPTYQWYRADDLSGDGKTEIYGETSANYTLKLADLNKFISVEIKPIALAGATTGTATMSPYVGAVTPMDAITLTKDISDNDVDHAIEINYTANPTFTAAITGISFNGHALLESQYTIDTTNNNKVTINPGVDTGNATQNSYLTTPATGDIVITATGFSDSVIQQTITAGVVANLTITTQPVPGESSGSAFATQPVVTLKDQFGNTCTTGPSAAETVTAAAATGTTGSWTAGGNTTANATAGVATFSGLNCTLNIYGEGAITFRIGALTQDSISFTIPLKAAVSLIADTDNNNVDNDIEITFTANADFEAAITGVSFDGTALTVLTDYIVSSGKITLKPSGGNIALRTPAAAKNVVITAMGYNDSTKAQTITAGAVASLTITTQPVVGVASGLAFTTQPVITLKDKYDNICSTGPSADASVTATAAIGTSGAWSAGIIGNTQTAVAGVASFSGLTCTLTSPGSGAIAFSIGSVTVTSDTFIIPEKSAISLIADTDNNNVDNDIEITFTANADFEAAITGVSFDGTALTVTTDYIVSSGKITLKPSGGNIALRTPAAAEEVVITAMGYNDSKVTQTIYAGVVASLTVTTQPVVGVESGLAFTTQPVITLKDKYDNICSTGPSADASVTATASIGTSGAWSTGIIGNTQTAVAGVASFSGLTCTLTSPGSGAIAFSIGSITVASDTFIIPEKSAISLTADTDNNNVDNDIEITFIANADFEAAITGVSLNGTALTVSTDYIVSSGKITLKPSGGNIALRTPAVAKDVVITAMGYNDSKVTQTILHGAVTTMAVTHEITSPTSNGGQFAGQPVITLKDQYGNTCTSDNSTQVKVIKNDTGSWTLTGTTTITVVNGVATFANLGATNSSYVANVQLAFQATGLTEVTSAQVNLPAPVVATTPTPTPAPTPMVEEITVDVKQGETDTTISEITIERTTDTDGSKSDTVTYDEDSAAETVEELKDSGEDVARIVIPDSNDEVSETRVNVPANSLEVLAEGEINLQIETEEAMINIPQASLQSASEGMDDDLYFNLVPVKEEEQQNEIAERALFEAAIVSGDSQNNITVVGVPITIETNMPSSAVDITLPLTGITVPTDPAERDAFLNQLAVYIEHSDGTKELVKGEIVEYKTGVLGIRFHITKFSVFTIVQTDVFVKSTACEVVKMVEPADAVIKGTDITATVANKVSSITIKANVSDKAVWELYSDKACKKILANHKIKLNTGTNKAYLKVTAEDGTVKTYTLTITRNKSSVADITKVIVPAKAVIKGKIITAIVENSVNSIAIKVTTSEKATWKLYSDKACKKEITSRQMKLKEGINTVYLKVTAEGGKTSNVYTLKVTRKAASVSQYSTHVKLGLIGSKAYAEKVAKIIEQDYDSANVVIVKEGKYYRVYFDFTDKTEAKEACEDMINKKYIKNYYFYEK